MFIERQYDQLATNDELKLALVSEQFRARIDIFQENRAKALELIAQNWPATHPNLGLWFNQQSLDFIQLLSQVNSIWYVSTSWDTQWRVPAISQQRQITPYIDLTPYQEDIIHRAEVFTINDKRLVTGLIKPVYQHEQLTGWLICLSDVESIFEFLVGEYRESNLAAAMLVNGHTIMETKPAYSAITYTAPLAFDDKSIELKLTMQGSGQHKWLYILASALVIVSFAVISQLFVRKSINASKTQHRFMAASKSSLDGLLIFTSVKEQFVLTDFNRVAQNMLPMVTLGQQPLNYVDLVSLLELSEHDFLQQAPESVLAGNIFEHSFQMPKRIGVISHIKIQIVQAGTDIAVTIRDISLRRQTQAVLKAREEKYRRLVDGLSGHFLYSLSTQGAIESVSDTVQDVLGYEVDEAKSILSTLFLAAKSNDCYKPISLHGNIERGITCQLSALDKFGEQRLIEFTELPVVEHGELVSVDGIARDITKEKALADEILHQANHDALTGLYNRYAFDNQLGKVIETVASGNREAALCYVDLDQFKVVNDTSGHMAGDELLNQLGMMITNLIEPSHIVARLGGDEFGIIFIDCDIDSAALQAQCLIDKINEFRFLWEEQVFKLGASIGLAAIKTGFSSEEIMKAADVACYVAKDQGRNRVNIYREDDEALNGHKSRIDWVNRIQGALDNNNFVLYCQTIKSIDSYTSDRFSQQSYEILLRMIDEHGELISPALFIPAAERFSMMAAIDRWVFDQATYQLAQSADFMAMTDKCSINLSGASIVDMELAHHIVNRLRELNIPPEKVCFEVTETAAVTKLNEASAFIQILRDYGCKFALDDFGAGMCSFAYLKNLPVDFIKIDGSFVKNMTKEATDRAIVQSIDDIAKSLGKETIAEFVGDMGTEHALKQIGVNYVQGFYIDKPMPFEQYLSNLSCTSRYIA